VGELRQTPEIVATHLTDRFPAKRSTSNERDRAVSNTLSTQVSNHRLELMVIHRCIKRSLIGQAIYSKAPKAFAEAASTTRSICSVLVCPVSSGLSSSIGV